MSTLHRQAYHRSQLANRIRDGFELCYYRKHVQLPLTSGLVTWSNSRALAMSAAANTRGSFSHQSDAAGIPGGWSGDSDDPNRKYLRVLRDIDSSSEDQRKKFTDMVGDGVTVVGVI